MILPMSMNLLPGVSARLAARLLIAAFFVFPFGVAADESDPTLRNASPGYSSRLRNRFFSPVEIQVINSGPERVATAIVEAQGDRSNLKVAIQRSLTLPASSLRFFDVPGYVDMHVSGSRTNRQMMPVLLTDGRVQTWSRMETFAGISDERHIVYYCNDPRRLSYRFLDDFQLAGKSLKSSRIVGSNKDLPQRPVYYQAIDFVVLGITPDSVINEMQAAALRNWVENGGILIVTGSDPSRLEDIPALADLLPVSYLDTRMVEVLPLLSEFGTPFQAFQTIARHRLGYRTGDVLLGTKDDPWVVTRRAGLGHVIAVNFDTGNKEFQRWEGALSFWGLFSGKMSPLARYGTRIMAQGTALEEVLGSLTGKEVLGRNAVALYLLGVLILLAGPLFLLRNARRPEVAWGISVIAAMVAGCGAIGVAHTRKAQPEASLNEVYLAETLSGKTPWAIQAAIAAYSPSDKVFQIPTPNDTTWWRPSSSPIEPPETLPIEFKGENMTVHLPVHADDVRYLFWEGAIQGPAAPEARFEIGAEGLRVNIHEAGGNVLQDMFIKFRRLTVPLGDSTGSQFSLEKSVRPAKGDRSVSYSDKKVLQALDQSRNKIINLLIPSHQASGVSSMALKSFGNLANSFAHESPALYYWSSDPAFPEDLDSVEGKRRSIGLVRVNNEITYGEGKLVFPQGVLPRELVMKPAAVRGDATGEIVGQKECVFGAKWSLPADAPALDVDQARMFAHLSGEGYTFELYAVPLSEVPALLASSPNSVSIDGLEPLGSTGKVTLKEVSRFFNPETRDIYGVIKILSSGPDPGSARPLSQVMRPWQLKNLEVELEGSRL